MPAGDHQRPFVLRRYAAQSVLPDLHAVHRHRNAGLPQRHNGRAAIQPHRQDGVVAGHVHRPAPHQAPRLSVVHRLPRHLVPDHGPIRSQYQLSVLDAVFSCRRALHIVQPRPCHPDTGFFAVGTGHHRAGGGGGSVGHPEIHPAGVCLNAVLRLHLAADGVIRVGKQAIILHPQFRRAVNAPAVIERRIAAFCPEHPPHPVQRVPLRLRIGRRKGVLPHRQRRGDGGHGQYRVRPRQKDRCAPLGHALCVGLPPPLLNDQLVLLPVLHIRPAQCVSRNGVGKQHGVSRVVDPIEGTSLRQLPRGVHLCGRRIVFADRQGKGSHSGVAVHLPAHRQRLCNINRAVSQFPKGRGINIRWLE